VNEKQRVAISALIGHFDPERRAAILRHLPSEDGEAISELAPPTPAARQSYLTSIEERIERIHYSWLAKAIGEQPALFWGHFIAALPASSQKGVAHLLNVSELPPLPPITKRLLLEQLYTSMHEGDLMPPEMLGDLPLLTLTKRQLVEVIGLLGLFDIAAALRRVLEREKKEQVRLLLSDRENRYLDRCLTQQDPWPAPSLRLERWSGSERDLARLLQQFGLKRLGAALSRSPASLLWHLSHRLDTQRGHRLEEEASSEVEIGVHRALGHQVEDAVDFLAKEQS